MYAIDIGDSTRFGTIENWTKSTYIVCLGIDGTVLFIVLRSFLNKHNIDKR